MDPILFTTKSKTQQFFQFEKYVCSYLGIDQCHFQIYTRHHKGYALLLRNWIRESHDKGMTAKEVAKTIRSSKLIRDEMILFCVK
ncbi:hypothetical protein [Aquimarina algiphila]|uniref:Uncharacterized protein n=1 Tax=Aquimarina algiphila TaxID=2047982 RepID=A0A554VED6_9FLAO|nr:hypothetical protein [Aquimarina algiphila]TSE05388.1 hypothetical protein FOF46_22760 [Aquimarina algiphila]